jgi:hypothetical protein
MPVFQYFLIPACQYFWLSGIAERLRCRQSNKKAPDGAF